jgi:glycerol-3-phosphate dehydrogenase (NAD(P)+)
LPGVPLAPNLHLTTDVEEAWHDADLVVVAIPTVYLRSTLQPLVGRCPGRLPALSLAKGLENGTFLRPTQIIQDVLGDRLTAALSGPSHAEEVSRGLPTSVVVAAEDDDLARQVQAVFNTERFRVYCHSDVKGVELAGALKNVIGIAAGISDGLGFGDNAKSALLTRALVEMTRLGVALGADPATFMGLAGLGDLITTCISPHGRNRRVGERLGRGERLADILNSMTQVAEGIWTAKAVYDRAASMGVDIPIMAEVYRVLYEGKPPQMAVQDLMRRGPKREW